MACRQGRRDVSVPPRVTALAAGRQDPRLLCRTWIRGARQGIRGTPGYARHPLRSRSGGRSRRRRFRRAVRPVRGIVRLSRTSRAARRNAGMRAAPRSRRSASASGRSTESPWCQPEAQEMPTRPAERLSTADHSSAIRIEWWSGPTTPPARIATRSVATASAAPITSGFGHRPPKERKCRSGVQTATKPCSSRSGRLREAVRSGRLYPTVRCRGRSRSG